MNRIRKILKNNDGLSNTVEMLGVAILLSIFSIAAIVVAGYVHNLTVLDRFADEMVSKAALEGRCAGAEIDRRYRDLVASTGITPTIAFDADYYDYTSKTVQYGEAITVSLSAEIKVIGFGTNYLTNIAVRKSTEQSQQYWKDKD